MRKIKIYTCFQILAFGLVVMALILSGCRKERPKPSWDLDLISPLLKDSVTIMDIISDTLIAENPDHSISFVFDQKLYEVNVDSLVMLPDTLFHFEQVMSWMPYPYVPMPPGEPIIEARFDWPLDYETFGFEGIALESAFIRSGKIYFEVYNSSEGTILSEFKINSAVKNEADTFYITEIIPAGQLASKAFDFSGYRLSLKGSNNDTVNMVNYTLGLFADPFIPDTLILYQADSFAVNIYFEDIVVDYAGGNFGRNTYYFGPESYKVDVFGDLDLAGLSMKDAIVNLRIENNYGVDGLVKIKEFAAFNSLTGESAYLQDELIDSNLYIKAATQTGDGLGIIHPNNNSFDFSNSNFNELLRIMPDEVTYTLEVTSNPSADSSSREHFFYYDDPIRVFVEADINQGIMIRDLFVENRVSWNGEGVDISKVNEGKLIVVLDNGFPFSFDINLYFEDEDFAVIDTLLFDEMLAGGILGADSSVVEPVETRIDVVLTESLEESIKDAKYARYELLINSAENKHVKIYSTDIMKMKIIGDFRYRVEQ
ncbi:MAG: hypothetical protein R2764_00625 [Bacteroidales bacterium]